MLAKRDDIREVLLALGTLKERIRAVVISYVQQQCSVRSQLSGALSSRTDEVRR